MMGHAFRAAFIGAVILVSAATVTFAQQNTEAPPVPATILTQINQAAPLPVLPKPINPSPV